MTSNDTMKLAAAALLAACCGALPASAQTTATTPPTDLYDDAHYERVGRLIYGYQRLLGTADDKQRAAIAQHAPPALADHVARMTAEYDAIMHEHGDVPDTRLNAAIGELQALSLELAAWKKTQGQ